MNAAVLIPVKNHARAKSRMSMLMNPDERAALAWAMFEDMIAALSALPWKVVVATNESRVHERVRRLGWEVFAEQAQQSESTSIDACSRQLEREGVDTVLRLPADLPLVSAGDIRDLMSLPVMAPAAVLAPSWDVSGTNALLRTPPTLFPSQFGPDSFALHLRAAAAAGAEIRVVDNKRLALDLDDPADICRFLTWRADTHTHRTLMGFHIPERLARYAAQRNPD